MRNSRYKQGHSQSDFLNGEARAVIDAEFGEMPPAPHRQTFTQYCKEKWRWIRQQLLRTP